MPTSAARPSPASPPSPWIRSGASTIHGRGLYASRPIPRDTRVIEYVGEKITKAESRRRERERIARLHTGGDGTVTIFELNQRYDLDGRDPENLACLANHSCAPNCHAENLRGHIWIIADRDIAAGEELTFDYGFPFGEWRLHPCRCGAPECPGFIVNQYQRWRLRRILRQRPQPLPFSIENAQAPRPAAAASA